MLPGAHWMDGQRERTRGHATELSSRLVGRPGTMETFTKHQLILLGESTQSKRNPLCGRICFRIVRGGGMGVLLPFPELLSVDWDSLFTRFLPLRAS